MIRRHGRQAKAFFIGRYGSLLTVLILIFLLQPTAETLVGKYLLESLFIVSLLAGLRAVLTNKHLLRFLLVLFTAAFVCVSVGMAMELSNLFTIGLVGRSLFLSLVAVTILYDLFSSDRVTSDTLAGAVCFYLLIAYIWAHFFVLTEIFVPESFSFTSEARRLELWLSREFHPFFYFSLVTMSTVGYGDMAPVSVEARTLATFEALLGQVYLTILVGRLVGMHLANRGQEK